MMLCCGHERKNKRYLILVMAVLLLFSVGCGQKEDGWAGAEDQQEQEVQKLAQFSDVGGTVWSETWEADSSYYEKIAVQMDALVIVPTVEKMSVAEVKEFTFDKENIQMVAQGIFGSSVYSYDEKKLPEDMLENKQKAVETELLESGSAGEDFVLEPAGEFQSDHYIGERNGTEYLLDFKDEESVDGEGEVRKILFMPRRGSDVWPEELKGMEKVEKRTSSCEPDNKEDLDKARKAAEDFLKETGFSDTLCSRSDLLLWVGTPSESSGQKAKTVQRGYCFTYVTGADGLAFRNPYSATDVYSWSEDAENEYPGYTQIKLEVTDIGVICAEWRYPIMTTSVTSDVKLLPFEDIKNVIRESIGACVDAYAAPSDEEGKAKAKEEVYDIKVTRLRLGYFRLKDPSRKGYYSYVPAWQAHGICIVNAIDGTIIDSPR